MKRIICLDPLIANQIAAGEVVEKAASVVKELVENSIDANATKIEIEVEGGGIHLIRVRDNGHGILKEDLSLAFFRHATSKIHSINDLAAIASLGFRGEALASIASVSKCTLASKALLSDEAWQIHIHPDLQTTLSPAAHAVGTTIIVADLFYNTPVRRKFLRSEKSENLAIEEIVKRLALAAPHVTFTLKQNQKLIRRYEAICEPAAIEARVGSIVGQSFITQAKAVKFEREALTLYGWIAPPDLQKRHTDCQYFFVNQRMVKDRILSHAIRTCHQRHPRFVEGTYPAYVLFLALDPTEVDVNVHPTKQEVRFSQAVQIYDFINHGIQKAWDEPLSSLRGDLYPKQSRKRLDCSDTSCLATTKLQKRVQPTQHKIKMERDYQRYIFVEEAEGIRIIDFQRAKKELLKCVGKRPLLFPLEVVLPPLKRSIDVIIETLKKVEFECRVENNRLFVFQQSVLLEAPIEASNLLDLIKKIDFSACNDLFMEYFLELCSHDKLNTLNWSELNLSTLPSVCLTHEDIEKAIKV